VTRFATGLAFLAKSAVIVAMGTTLVQRQWSKLYEKSFTITEIDVMTSAFTDP
jgi:hypothetical protein